MSTKDTLIKKLGSEEAYKQYMRSLGSKGGTISKPPPDHPTMFSNNRELASRAGQAGGAKKRLDKATGKRIINKR